MTLKLSRLAIRRDRALDQADRHFAALLTDVIGPFAEVHRMKREQAEAGGGSLIADEAERQAVLEKAADQAARLTEIETRRMAAKRAIRAAGSKEEIAAIVEGLE
jgi:hypothetical protein